MEHRLDDHLAQADRAAIEDGEAGGLLGCWLCGGYFDELADEHLCGECAGFPNAAIVAELHRGFETILAAKERVKRGVRRVAGIGAAVQMTLEAMDD